MYNYQSSSKKDVYCFIRCENLFQNPYMLSVFWHIGAFHQGDDGMAGIGNGGPDMQVYVNKMKGLSLMGGGGPSIPHIE